jgi:hypothetical protein
LLNETELLSASPWHLIVDLLGVFVSALAIRWTIVRDKAKDKAEEERKKEEGREEAEKKEQAKESEAKRARVAETGQILAMHNENKEMLGKVIDILEYNPPHSHAEFEDRDADQETPLTLGGLKFRSPKRINGTNH